MLVRRLIVWGLVLAAGACLLGPGRFMPKRLEGPVLFTVSANHGVAALDLVGLGLLLLAVCLLSKSLQRASTATAPGESAAPRSASTGD